MEALIVATPAWLLAILALGISCVASVGLAALVRRVVGRSEPGQWHNSVLSTLLGVGGTFAAIVIALATFVVWDRLTSAQQAESDQGAALIALYHDAEVLPDPGRTSVQAAIRDYTTSVIRDEFPDLADRRSSDQTERSLSRLNAAVSEHLGNTGAPGEVTNIVRAQYRLVAASTSSIPGLLWLLLVFACVLLLLMSAPLFMHNMRYQMLSSLLLGCTLGMAMFLILVADQPFSGPLQVRPTDLERNLHTYTVIDAAGAEASVRGGAPGS